MALMIELPPEAERHLREIAARQGREAEQVAASVLVEALTWELVGALAWEVEEGDPAADLAAVREGLAQAERGEGRPAAAVFAELKAKHGL
jgi:predicted transcriptional regulator